MQRGVAAGLWLLLAALLGGCATLGPAWQPPRLSLVNLRLAGATLFEQRFVAQIRVQNPNDRVLAIRGFSFDLEVNGEPLASGVSDRALSVPAFGEALTEVYATTTLASLIRQFAALDRAQSFRYRLYGRIRLAGLGGAIPFNFEGEVPVVPPPAAPARRL